MSHLSDKLILNHHLNLHHMSVGPGPFTVDDTKICIALNKIITVLQQQSSITSLFSQIINDITATKVNTMRELSPKERGSY